uniref:Uncharacterized protein n=1 Tax=uncultured marine virus TaxID=186617 RepID=A0A0F7L6V4_9VIRU|nr:hypothetical protein [uncultured marine virus]
MPSSCRTSCLRCRPARPSSPSSPSRACRWPSRWALPRRRWPGSVQRRARSPSPSPL